MPLIYGFVGGAGVFLFFLILGSILALVKHIRKPIKKEDHE